LIRFAPVLTEVRKGSASATNALVNGVPGYYRRLRAEAAERAAAEPQLQGFEWNTLLMWLCGADDPAWLR
jgi:hypothetical protein